MTDNLLHNSPILLKVVPIERSVWELSIGTSFVLNACLYQELWVIKVKVLKINTLIVRGKPKTFKGKHGYRKNYKKAIVTLKEGQSIDTSMEIKWRLNITNLHPQVKEALF